MAASQIKSRKYIGKPIDFIRKELGEWNGYFFPMKYLPISLKVTGLKKAKVGTWCFYRINLEKRF